MCLLDADPYILHRKFLQNYFSTYGHTELHLFMNESMSAKLLATLGHGTSSIPQPFQVQKSINKPSYLEKAFCVEQMDWFFKCQKFENCSGAPGVKLLTDYKTWSIPHTQNHWATLVGQWRFLALRQKSKLRNYPVHVISSRIMKFVGRGHFSSIELIVSVNLRYLKKFQNMLHTYWTL